jgi:hypothetical protein
VGEKNEVVIKKRVKYLGLEKVGIKDIINK